MKISIPSIHPDISFKQSSILWDLSPSFTLLPLYIIAGILPLSVRPVDLFILGILGLFFCAKWHLKGFLCASVLLIGMGIFRHMMFETHHMLRLGLEASLECSFFAAALLFQEKSEERGLSEAQIKSKILSIEHLEEEALKSQERFIHEDLKHAHQKAELVKNYEEIHAEKESLDILNDVLRSANAAHFEQTKNLETQIREVRYSLSAVERELMGARKEIDRLKDADYALENRNLMSDLNKARFSQEQTCLINETLAHLHARETIRAQEAIDRLAQVLARKEELEKAYTDLKSQMEAMNQLSSFTDPINVEITERDQGFLTNLKRTASNEENNWIEEKQELLKALAAAEEKAANSLRTEDLYMQLRDQFEEKKRVLQATRSALFYAETALNTLAIEREEEAEMVVDSSDKECTKLYTEIEFLKEENSELESLATALIQSPGRGISFTIHRTPLPLSTSEAKPPKDSLREALTPKKKKKNKTLSTSSKMKKNNIENKSNLNK